MFISTPLSSRTLSTRSPWLVTLTTPSYLHSVDRLSPTTTTPVPYSIFEPRWNGTYCFCQTALGVVTLLGGRRLCVHHGHSRLWTRSRLVQFLRLYGPDNCLVKFLSTRLSPARVARFPTLFQRPSLLRITTEFPLSVVKCKYNIFNHTLPNCIRV